MGAATVEPTGFEAMGRPIPFARRQHAYDAIRGDMAPGATVEEAMGLVNRVADLLERDQPYEALRSASPPSYAKQDGLTLDYTGALRLVAHLLA